MEKYGIDKVRGGCWSQVDIRYLPQDLVNTYSTRCYECGYYGHSSSNCRHVPQYRDSSQDHSNRSFSESDSDSGSVDTVEFCVRCGRNNHSYNNCNASFTVNRDFIGNDDCCARCGRGNHWRQDCFAKVDIWGYRLD